MIYKLYQKVILPRIGITIIFGGTLLSTVPAFTIDYMKNTKEKKVIKDNYSLKSTDNSLHLFLVK